MAITHYPPHSRMPPHDHEEACISFVLAGKVREGVLDAEEIGRPGSIAFKPAGVAHENGFGEAGAAIVCIRPLPQAAATLLPAAWRWLHGPAAARITFALAEDLIGGDPLGTVEECLASLAHALSGVPGREVRPAPQWVGEVRDCLHAQPASRPSVTALASEAGVHPVYLTRRFRARYGLSVSAYLRRLRISLAAERIAAASEEGLAQIAQNLGFADQSHFSRAFQAELGISASRYRALLSLAGRSAAGGTDDPNAPVLLIEGDRVAVEQGRSEDRKFPAR